MMEDLWVNDPLEKLSRLNPQQPAVIKKDDTDVSTVPPEEQRSLIRISERFPRTAVCIGKRDEAKTVTVDNQHRNPNEFLSERLKGVNVSFAPGTNIEAKTGLAATAQHKIFAIHEEETIPMSYKKLNFIRHKLRPSRSNDKPRVKRFKRKWIDYPHRVPHIFPAEKLPNKDEIMPDIAWPKAATPELAIMKLRYPPATSETYWKQVISEWARNFDVLKLIDVVEHNPQPVEVILQMASVTGTERLRGVLATVLPERPSIERAQGHYWLISKVKKQISDWDKAFKEMMDVVNHLAHHDIHRPVRQAAVIITCARNQKSTPTLQKELWSLLRSQQSSNRWAASQLLALSGCHELSVLQEIFSQLFDYSTHEAKQNQLMEILSVFPEGASLFVDELTARLNSLSVRERVLACQIIPHFFRLHESRLPYKDQVQTNLLLLLFDDNTSQVRMASAAALKECGWGPSINHHFTGILVAPPIDLLGRLTVLRKMERYKDIMPELDKTLMMFVGDDLSCVRAGALRLIPQIAPDNVSAFLACLKIAANDRSVDVRLVALTILRQFCQRKDLLPTVISCWLHVAEHDSCPALRKQATESIFQMGQRRHLGQLYGLLSRMLFVERSTDLRMFFVARQQMLLAVSADFKLEGNPLPDDLKKLVGRKVIKMHRMRNLQTVFAAEYASKMVNTVKDGAWRDVSVFDGFVESFE